MTVQPFLQVVSLPLAATAPATLAEAIRQDSSAVVELIRRTTDHIGVPLLESDSATTELARARYWLVCEGTAIVGLVSYQPWTAGGPALFVHYATSVQRNILDLVVSTLTRREALEPAWVWWYSYD